MFIDKAKIYVKAGTGGRGCISFRREMHVPFGGPDGGNGGRGGSIYIEADKKLKTLYDFSRKVHFEAEVGDFGKGSNKTGHDGEDLYIKVPCGTQVFLFDEKTKDKKFRADLINDQDKICIAKGGRGGRGNASFKTKIRTAPRVAEKGEPGEELTVLLELKVIASIGLIGYPNAGKSTLLSRITKAKPQIADYPFTTLTPNLGVVFYREKNYIIADIPGLVEGSHSGKGLGFDFLRHVERTKVLVHLIDINGYDNHDVYENFDSINKELLLYNKSLAEKKQIVLLTKIDTLEKRDFSTIIKKIKAYKKIKVKTVIPISAVSGEGIELLLDTLSDVLAETKDVELPADTIKEENFIYEPEFNIKKIDDIYYVKGKKIENLVSMTMFDEEESFYRFYNIIKKMGVEKELLKLGIQEGDLVIIGDKEFNYKSW
jgi:GTPase